MKKKCNCSKFMRNGPVACVGCDHIVYDTEEEKFYVVLADYTDSWNEPFGDHWVVAKAHPSIKSNISDDLAVYDNIKDAQTRERCILDHATIIEYMTAQEIGNYIGFPIHLVKS